MTENVGQWVPAAHFDQVDAEIARLTERTEEAEAERSKYEKMWQTARISLGNERATWERTLALLRSTEAALATAHACAQRYREALEEARRRVYAMPGAIRAKEPILIVLDAALADTTAPETGEGE